MYIWHPSVSHNVVVHGVYRFSWSISIKCVFLWMKVSRLLLWVQQVMVLLNTSMCRFVAHMLILPCRYLVTLILVTTVFALSFYKEHTHTQPFNDTLSVTTLMGQYQKKTIHPLTPILIIKHSFYQLPPSTTIHSVLLVQFTCLTVFFPQYNLSPGPLVYLLNPVLYTGYISSPSYHPPSCYMYISCRADCVRKSASVEKCPFTENVDQE